MRILITGGVGFIGSNLTEFLLKKGHEIILVDDLSTGKIENINHLLDRLQFVEQKVELLDLSSFENVDAVIHLAAQVSVPFSISEFKQSSSTNILASINVVDFCSKHNIPLIYASSSAVYGEMEQGNDNQSNVDLLSPYAVDKYVLELYTKVSKELYQLSSIGLRFFNVYGPKQDPTSSYSGVISIFVDRLIKELPIHINGGHQTRDFIYVHDVVRCIHNSLEVVVSSCMCERINVLTGTVTSIDTLADILSDYIGSPVKKIYKPMEPGDPEKSNGTTEKMTEILNIKPDSMVAITDGLKRTIDFLN